MPDEHTSKGIATKAGLVLQMTHEERVALGAEALAVMVASFAGSLVTQAEDRPRARKLKGSRPGIR